MRKTVMVIMVYTTFDTAWERVRNACTLKTIAEAKKHGYEVVVLDGGSPAKFVKEMEALGVRVYRQYAPGMGNGCRETLRLAQEIATGDQGIVWIEPEKYPLVSKLAPAVRRFEDKHLDLLLLKRTNLDSYPPEQAMAYQMIALATKYLTGIDSDFGWGPMILSKRAIEYFLTYKSDYGDLWDSIHCPKLAIINDSLPWELMPVDYIHPHEQTAAETGIELLPKRIHQMDQLVQAIIREVDKLHMRKKNVK
jgi:hypothetical protein